MSEAPTIDPQLEAWLRKELEQLEAFEADRRKQIEQAEADIKEAEERRDSFNRDCHARAVRRWAIQQLLGQPE